MPSVKSVHVPVSLDKISIRGTGAKKVASSKKDSSTRVSRRRKGGKS